MKQLIVILVLFCAGCVADRSEDAATVNTQIFGNSSVIIRTTGLSGFSASPSHSVSSFTSAQIQVYHGDVLLSDREKEKFIFNNGLIQGSDISYGTWTFVFFNQCAFSVAVDKDSIVYCNAVIPENYLNYSSENRSNTTHPDTLITAEVSSFSVDLQKNGFFRNYLCALKTNSDGSADMYSGRLSTLKIFSRSLFTRDSLTKSHFDTETPVAVATDDLVSQLTPETLNDSNYCVQSSLESYEAFSNALSKIAKTLSVYSEITLSDTAQLHQVTENMLNESFSADNVSIMNGVDFNELKNAAEIRNSSVSVAQYQKEFYLAFRVKNESNDDIYAQIQVQQNSGIRTISGICSKRFLNGALVDGFYYFPLMLSAADVQNSIIKASVKLWRRHLTYEMDYLMYSVAEETVSTGINDIYVTGSVSTGYSMGTLETELNKAVYNDVKASTVDMYVGIRLNISDSSKYWLYLQFKNQITNSSMYSEDSKNGWYEYSTGTKNIDSVVNSANNGLIGDNRIEPVTSGTYKGYYRIRVSDIIKTGTLNKGNYLWTPYGDNKSSQYPGAFNTAGLGKNGFVRMYARYSDDKTLFCITETDFGTNEFYGTVMLTAALCDESGNTVSAKEKEIRVAFKSADIYSSLISPVFSLYYTDSLETQAGGAVLKTSYPQQLRAGKKLSFIIAPHDAQYALYEGKPALKFYFLLESADTGLYGKIYSYYLNYPWYDSVYPSENKTFLRFENYLYGLCEVCTAVSGVNYRVTISSVSPNGKVYSKTESIAVFSN